MAFLRHASLNSSVDLYQNETVKNDQMLSRTLSEIIRECHLTSDQIKELISCSLGGDTDQNSMFKLLLEQEPSLSDAFPEQNELLSFLWNAVLCCYWNTAELLLRLGADVNELYVKDCPNDYLNGLLALNEKSNILHALLLMYPSSFNERFVGLVLEHTSTDFLKAQDDCGRTVLHLAVLQDRVQTTKLLLEKGANVNVADDTDCGNTPLLVAAGTAKASELVPLLIKHGADVTFTNKLHLNVLACLAENFRDSREQLINLARDLIEKGVSLGTDSTDDWPHEPIIRAAIKGNDEFVNLFLDYGENPNARSRIGVFPLYSAASNNISPKVLRTLLRRGADIDLKTTGLGETALHNACHKVVFNNIEELLSAGADMFAKDHNGKMPFAYIYLPFVNVSIVQLMLKTLALRKARLGLMVESEQEWPFGTSYPRNLTFYHDCKACISRAISTRFIKSCSFFELLTKCQCQIVKFMVNREFEAKFKLYDLRIFYMYARDIHKAFERVQCYYKSLVKQEEIINEAFYNVLPHLIVNKVGLLICDECEFKTIVQASRSGDDQLII